MGQRCCAHHFRSVTLFSRGNEFVTILYVEGSNAQPFRHRSGFFAARISERTEVMCMILKLNAKQSAKARKLARRECCNCYKGNCILLDDGDPCVCPQLITYSHIICKWFKVAVLPVDKDLHIELMKPPNTKLCSICGRYYVPNSNRSKYCSDCRKVITRRQAAERKQKQRLMSRNKGVLFP